MDLHVVSPNLARIWAPIHPGFKVHICLFLSSRVASVAISLGATDFKMVCVPSLSL